MNCKPGDLAVVVSTLGWSSLDGYLGCIVEVAELDHISKWYGPMWKVEHHKMEGAADACLRPIRDGEGNESWFKAAPLTEKPKQPEAV